MAGLLPGAVICEIMNDDGTMARRPQLASFAQRHQLPLLHIEDIARVLQEAPAHDYPQESKLCVS